MDYIQIGCISLDPTTLNNEDLAWIESLEDEQNVNFVEVTDGDYSEPREIDREIIPHDDPRLDEGYVLFDPITTDFDPGDREVINSGFATYKTARPAE
jgi:hypothetical protein